MLDSSNGATADLNQNQKQDTEDSDEEQTLKEIQAKLDSSNGVTADLNQNQKQDTEDSDEEQTLKEIQAKLDSSNGVTADLNQNQKQDTEDSDEEQTLKEIQAMLDSSNGATADLNQNQKQDTEDSDEEQTLKEIQAMLDSSNGVTADLNQNQKQDTEDSDEEQTLKEIQAMLDSSNGATADLNQNQKQDTEDSDVEQTLKEIQYGIPHSIVYTTKLDDMKIFKENTADMRVDTIHNSIIKESKPKFSKRKRTHRTNGASSGYSYKDLSCSIESFNRKVARIAGNNNHLLSMCTPVRAVLQDFKYNILRTQSDASKNSQINEPIQANNISGKLEVKIVYDQQHGEADMYILDKNYLVQGYNKFRIDNKNYDNFHSLAYDKYVSEVFCCCWHNREKILKSLAISILPNKTVMFMRKPHKCAVNLCRCCCRHKAKRKSAVATSPSPTLLKPSEPPSVWLNKMPKKHVSQPSLAKSTHTLLSESLSVVSTPSVKPDIPEIVESHFLHSTNIDFGEEYYVIGADGHIKLHLKHCKDEQKLLKYISETANSVVGDICCWYKREEFARSLLQLSALPATVDYIRGVHPCSPTFCNCCCLPSNTEKIEITPLPKAARHTNDLISKKVNIKVRFSAVVEKNINSANAIIAKPITAKPPAAVRKTNNMVSFHVSLSSFDMISKGQNRSFTPLISEDEPPRSVKVRVDKSGNQRNKTVIESTQPLNNFTTKELRMLDMIFCAVKNALPTRKTFEFKKRSRKNEGKKIMYSHTIYPILLNKQLCIAADLRCKRFMPPINAHLKKYNVPPNE